MALLVRTSTLNLGQPSASKRVLYPLHQGAPYGHLLMAGSDGQVIDKSSVPVIARHGGGYQNISPLAIGWQGSHKEKLWLAMPLALNNLVRIVPRPDQSAVTP